LKSSTFENFIDGHWQCPVGNLYLCRGGDCGSCPFNRVARAGGVDVAAACAAAAVALGDWQRRGYAVRRAELARLPAWIDDQAPLQAPARHGPHETASRSIESTDAERVAAGLTDLVRGLPAHGSSRSGMVMRPSAHAVARLVIDADADILESCRRLLPLLYEGHSAVVLLLYQDARRLPVRLLTILALIAEHLPAGVLNVITGLGLEAGLALVRHPLAARAPRPMEPADPHRSAQIHAP
jgi:aldehyde dehydrogenase